MLGHLVLSHNDANGETRLPAPLVFRWIRALWIALLREH